MNRRHIPVVSCAILALVACGSDDIDHSGPIADWPAIGGAAAAQRFTPLTQVTPKNVDRLEVAWTYHTGDVSPGTETHGATAFQATPLVVNDTMFLCTPFNRVIALDPETGQERWVHDPQVDLTGVYTPTCRGVAHWQDKNDAGHCGQRILSGTLDARLIALDARTGEACLDFGENGSVDLTRNLGDVRLAEYYVSSAPLVIGDLVITGSFVMDGQRVDAPPGVVRAFDVRTGELRWAFDPVPPDRQPVTAEAAGAGANFTRSTPNSWGNLSADVERGIVYLPTGGSQPDHYRGVERGNLDHYGTSVVALDARDGKPLWNFQTVHRDVWDWDVAAQPVLFDQHGTTPGVIVATKMGHVFLLNRETGEPLFPVEERPVPAST
ncbi:MAG: PQQ-binding-like beta-propeller repeat protein, partial [Haliea sp.]